MKTVDQLQRQLVSLGELRTIVKTMKALSAVSIRQYERAVTALASYYHTVELGLTVILHDMPPAEATAGRAALPRHHTAIIFGSDHGLCGRFNEEITSYALKRMAATGARPEEQPVFAIGARLAASLEREDVAVNEHFQLPGTADHIPGVVQRILVKLDEWRERVGEHDVRIYYNRHSELGGYQPVTFQLLPLDLARFRGLQKANWPSRRLPAFTMAREVLLSRLLRQYLFVSLVRACAESQASEHASRVAAMQSAQRNLDERLDEVTMVYRRARQDLITAELVDVVAGFEVIAGDNAAAAANHRGHA